MRMMNPPQVGGQLHPASQGMRTPAQLVATGRLPTVRPLDNWPICKNLTEAFLIVTNLLLMLKTGANLLALLLDSDRLIADYNGALFFNGTFRFCFILMNLCIFCGSGLCLTGLLIVTTQESRARLIRYFAISQIVLALLTLAVMAKLWFAPFKLVLSSNDSSDWQEAIRDYNYQFELDSNGLLPNSRPSSHQHHNQQQQQHLYGDSLTDSFGSQQATAYKYQSTIDRLQRSLGCCGIWSPDDWSLMNNIGLLAPSCCKNPTGLLASGLLTPTTTRVGLDSANNVQLALLNETIAAGHQAYRIEIFYCQAASSNFGCQRLIQERATRFIFNLRLTLLLLLSILFLNVMTQASLEHCSGQQQQAELEELTEALARHQSRTIAGNITTAATSSDGSSIDTLWQLQQAPPAYQHRHHSPAEDSCGRFATNAIKKVEGSHLLNAPPALIANKCDIDNSYCEFEVRE